MRLHINNINMKQLQFGGGNTRRSFMKPSIFFSFEKTFFKVSHKLFVIILRDIYIGLENFVLSFRQS